MKKNILIICAIALGISASAAPVSPSQAADAARRILGLGSTKASDITLVWDGLDPATKASDEVAPFYVFNRPGGGWVMLSGDDTLVPVIAWSDRNSFNAEDMPDNVRYVMDCIRANCVPVPGQVSHRNEGWTELLSGTKASKSATVTPIKEILTNEWDQGAPYNSNFPAYSAPGGRDGHYHTGCLATALSIMVAYHEWANPNGIVPEYKADKDYLVPVYTGGPYNLSSPTRSYRLDELALLKKDSDAQAAASDVKNALAQLMYDCAVTVKACFDTKYESGTTAYMEEVLKSFAERMGYNKAARMCCASNYSNGDWIAMMKAQVDAGSPVLYRGADSKGAGGHFFVLDGYGYYTGGTVFHFNFGWSGYANGYYSYSYLAPKPGSQVIDLSYSQWALLDFKPDKTGTSSYVPEIIMSAYENYYGLRFNEDKSMVIVGVLSNVKGLVAANNVQVALFKVGKDGVRADNYESVRMCNKLNPLNDNYYFFDGSSAFPISTPKSEWHFGDTFVLYYKMEGDKEWTKVPADHLGSVVYALPVMGGPFINVPENPKVGYVRLELLNVDTPINTKSANTYWRIDDTGYVWGTEEVYISNPGKHTITAVLDNPSGFGPSQRKITTTITVTE